MLPDFRGVRELRVVSARTARLNHVVGPGWLAIGDAAISHDPLSSRGISAALESGLRAAMAVSDVLHGRSTSPGEYAAWVEAAFAVYCRQHQEYYGQVNRWPDRLFWRRRRAVSNWPAVDVPTAQARSQLSSA